MATRQLVKLFKVAGKSMGQVALDPGVIHQPVQITAGRDQFQADRSKSLHSAQKFTASPAKFRRHRSQLLFIHVGNHRRMETLGQQRTRRKSDSLCVCECDPLHGDHQAGNFKLAGGEHMSQQAEDFHLHKAVLEEIEDVRANPASESSGMMEEANAIYRGRLNLKSTSPTRSRRGTF